MYMRRKNIMLHFSQLSQDTDFSNYLFEVVGVFKNVLNKLDREDLSVLFFSGLDDFAERREVIEQPGLVNTSQIVNEKKYCG